MRISITTLMLITACAALTQASPRPGGYGERIFRFDPVRGEELEYIPTPEPLPKSSIPGHPLHRINGQLDSAVTHYVHPADFHLALLAYDVIGVKKHTDKRYVALAKRVECSNTLYRILDTHQLPESLSVCEVARLKIESLRNAKDGNALDEKISKTLTSLWNEIFTTFRKFRVQAGNLKSPLPQTLTKDSWERDCTDKDIVKSIIARAPAILYFSALIRHDHAVERLSSDPSDIHTRPLRCLRIALSNYAPREVTERTLYDVELKAIKSIENYTPHFPVNALPRAGNIGSTAIRKIAEVSYPKGGHNAGFYAFIGHLPTSSASYSSIALKSEDSDFQWEDGLTTHFARPARK